MHNPLATALLATVYYQWLNSLEILGQWRTFLWRLHWERRMTQTIEFRMSVILHLVCWSHSAGVPPLPPLQQCPEVSHLHCSQLLHWRPGWWDTCNNTHTHTNIFGLSQDDVYTNILLKFPSVLKQPSWFLCCKGRGQTLTSDRVKRKGVKGNCYFL